LFLESDAIIKNISIVDAVGKPILTTSINLNNSYVGINHLPIGLYTIKILFNDGENYNYQFLKQ
jgi:hypothetical protein